VLTTTASTSPSDIMVRSASADVRNGCHRTLAAMTSHAAQRLADAELRPANVSSARSPCSSGAAARRVRTTKRADLLAHRAGAVAGILQPLAM